MFVVMKMLLQTTIKYFKCHYINLCSSTLGQNKKRFKLGEDLFLLDEI